MITIGRVKLAKHPAMRRSSYIWISFVAVAIVGVIAGLNHCLAGPPLNPPTPPLVRDATVTGGGWASGGCPPEYSFEKPSDESRSPEIEDRLKKQFPPGTSSEILERALKAQGFKLIEACTNDTAINRAIFRQSGGGLFGPYPAFALVAWKSDEMGKIIWTKGAVAYTGL